MSGVKWVTDCGALMGRQHSMKPRYGAPDIRKYGAKDIKICGAPDMKIYGALDMKSYGARYPTGEHLQHTSSTGRLPQMMSQFRFGCQSKED